jgi:hypothetical protein
MTFKEVYFKGLKKEVLARSKFVPLSIKQGLKLATFVRNKESQNQQHQPCKSINDYRLFGL